MGRAVQTIAAFTTAAGAGTNIVTPATGDSLAVISFTQSGTAVLEQLVAAGTTTDWVRVRSPRMHDASRSIQAWVGGVPGHNLLPWGNNQPLFSSDVPTVEIDNTGAGSNVVLLTYGYSDLPGVNPALDTWSNIEPRIQQLLYPTAACISGAIGQWGAGVTINAAYDVFEANRSYALLGWRCSAATAGVAITGIDTGNLKVGGPGLADGIQTQEYFITASERTGRAFIPVIQANNKGSTIVQTVDFAAATAVNVSLVMALLAP